MERFKINKNGEDKDLVETKIDSETLYEGGFFQLKRDRIFLPNGQETKREYITHPGAVMVIPLFDDNSVLIERQFRYPVGKIMTEFPAGKLDPNETILACAQRELKEETGYSASEFIHLTQIHPVMSYSTETIDLFIARGLTVGEAKLDDNEFLKIYKAQLSDLLECMQKGEISDVKTIIGIFWLEKFLSGKWKEI